MQKKLVLVILIAYSLFSIIESCLQGQILVIVSNALLLLLCFIQLVVPQKQSIEILLSVYAITQELILYNDGYTWATLFLLRYLDQRIMIINMLEILIFTITEYSVTRRSLPLSTFLTLLLLISEIYSKLSKSFTEVARKKVLDEISQDLKVIIYKETKDEVLHSTRNEHVALNPGEMRFKVYKQEESFAFTNTRMMIQWYRRCYTPDAIIIGIIDFPKQKYSVRIFQQKKEFLLGIYPQQFRRSEKLSKFKSHLQTIFSHKLKTPLNSAMGHLETAKKDDQIPVFVQEMYIKPALLNCTLQLYLVQDICDFISFEQESACLAGKSNLKEILRNVHDLIEYQCQQKNILVSITVNGINWNDLEKKQMNIYTDDNKLSRVLNNILNNSYRNTNPGGHIELEVKMDAANKLVTFKISDNGIGISQEKIQVLNTQLQQESIHKFIQGSNEIKIGSSLLITNKLIKLLNGSQQGLTVEPCALGGTIFSFQINVNQDIMSDCSLKSSQNKSIQRQHSLRNLRQVNPQKNSIFFSRKSKKLVSKQEITLVDIEPYAQKVEAIFVKQKKLSPRPKKRSLYKTPLITIRDRSRTHFENRFRKQSTGRAFMCESNPREQTSNNLNILQPTLSNFQVGQQIGSSMQMDNYIILVDDEPFNHQTLTMFLQSIGFKQFIKCFNGQECIEQVLKYKGVIQFIMMDVDMPVMDGIQATKILTKMMQNQEIPPIPIIGCTAHEDVETHQNCFNAGMVNVLVKPLFLVQLKEVIQALAEFDCKVHTISQSILEPL